MTKRRIASEVFYSSDEGEFHVLSSELLAEVDMKIAETLPQILSMTYDTYELSDKVTLTTGRVETLDIALGIDDEPLLVETQLSVMTMDRRSDEIEKVVVVTISQRMHIDQMTLHHAHEELHTLTTTFVSEPLHERYILYRYVDGHYSAEVEQYDLADPSGRMRRRPLTLYGAGELIYALDDAAVRSLNDVRARDPRDVEEPA